MGTGRYGRLVLGMTLKKKNIGVDWKSYSGKHAQSKVDFGELCDVCDTIGPDYLNKTVLRGERYTAVFIVPGRQFKASGRTS
jgi:hypothetical protein